MPWFECAQGMIYFAHIPKTGGTSVEDALEEVFGTLHFRHRTWAKEWAEGASRSTALRVSPQHLTARDARYLLPRSPDWSFAFVRNPVDRIVSEFMMHQRSKFARSKIAARGFSYWLGAMLAATEENPTLFDNHFRPQTDFLLSDTKVYKFEDGLSATMKEVFVHLKQDPSNLEIPHKLKAKAAKPNVSAADISYIEGVFSADYHAFGYPTQSVRPLKCLAHMRGRRRAPSIANAYRAGQI